MQRFSIFIDLRSSLLAFLPSSLQMWFCLSFLLYFLLSLFFVWNMCRVFIYLALCFLLVVVVCLILHLSNLLIWCFNHSLKMKYSRAKRYHTRANRSEPLGEIQRYRVNKADLQAVARSVCLFGVCFQVEGPSPATPETNESLRLKRRRPAIKKYNQNSVRFSRLQTVFKLANMHDTLPP